MPRWSKPCIEQSLDVRQVQNSGNEDADQRGKLSKHGQKKHRTKPLLDEEFFKHAELSMRASKKSLTLRLDSDVLEWFREKGKGYQTHINAILRTYMKAHSK